eukprot:SAG25_NODE_9896_length_353_cov_1.153543_1_plen_66_part_01
MLPRHVVLGVTLVAVDRGCVEVCAWSLTRMWYVLGTVVVPCHASPSLLFVLAAFRSCDLATGVCME